MLNATQWWRNAVIYQIVPWSFLDTDGDGRGTLRGIMQKLDYIAALGVEAIWLTPIYESPMDDLGYDITDMLDIDPVIGDLKIFDQLLALTHARGLKLILDQVWGHTSNRHFWFLESRESRTNPKADWYVWADPKPDGSPPNNWLSAFNGKSAWEWEPNREQYYLFHFLPSQPKLNWNNPNVLDAILKRAKFWLDRDVDGFRIDAPNFLMHDPELRDERPRPDDAPRPDGIDPDNPMAQYRFEHSFCRPEALEVLRPIRDLVDQYSGVMTLAEVTLCEDSIALSSQYVEGSHRAHLAYNSALLVEEPISARLMQQTLKKVQHYFSQGGNCWMVGNHDYGRLRSRWTGCDEDGTPYPEIFYHTAAAMLTTMPGALCLYQGDELGLSEASIPEDISEEQIRDPFGQALYPEVVGRDGSRTPMPWNSEATSAGFSNNDSPWLPIPEAHLDRAVNVQTRDPGSLLNTWRRLLHWRKHQPAITEGTCHVLDTEEPIFAFIRESPQQRLLCMFNLSVKTAHYRLPKMVEPCFTVMRANSTAKRDGQRLRLGSYGYFLCNLQPVCELHSLEQIDMSPPEESSETDHPASKQTQEKVQESQSATHQENTANQTLQTVLEHSQR